MLVKAVFTRNGEFCEGLQPEITILNLNTNQLEVDRELMSEKSFGVYVYNFNNYNNACNYHIFCNAKDNTLDSNGYLYGGNEFFTDYYLDRLVNKIKNNINLNENFNLYRV